MAAAVLAALLGFAVPGAAQLPAPPVIGLGPFQLGGYAAVTLSHSERPEVTERPEISEIVAALMVWGQISPRASYLVELDIAKRTTETWTGRESDGLLLPVRLYVEYTVHDLLRLRAGRFLTPFGQWNERHAEPLTWTPTRPLTTYRPFAKSLTGIMAAGETSIRGRDVGYAAFWSPSGSLDGRLDEAEESAFLRAGGARVAAEVQPGLTLGLSGAMVKRSRPAEREGVERAGPAPGRTAGLLGEDDEGGHEEDEREEDAHARALLGADLRWESTAFEFTAEGSWVAPVEHGSWEGGAFTMVALRLRGPLWAVARGEAYRLDDGTDLRVGFTGVAFRPAPRFVAKIGWQFTGQPTSRIPDGWFVSLSSLF